jgi:hypothetical protein
MLSGFVDSLLQTFENCRPGLSDEALKKPDEVRAYVTDLYEKEKPRLAELIQVENSHLSDELLRELVGKIDSRIRDVLIPAYARVARRFTLRERNDFYLVPDGFHVAERLLLTAVGIVMGIYMVRAPFIPLWGKEGVFLCMLAGLVYPEVRRWVAFKRYVSEVNELVAKTDDEIFRMDLALLTRETPLPGLGATARPRTESNEDGVSRPARTRQGG